MEVRKDRGGRGRMCGQCWRGFGTLHPHLRPTPHLRATAVSAVETQRTRRPGTSTAPYVASRTADPAVAHSATQSNLAGASGYETKKMERAERPFHRFLSSLRKVDSMPADDRAHLEDRQDDRHGDEADHRTHEDDHDRLDHARDGLDGIAQSLGVVVRNFFQHFAQAA